MRKNKAIKIFILVNSWKLNGNMKEATPRRITGGMPARNIVIYFG